MRKFAAFALSLAASGALTFASPLAFAQTNDTTVTNSGDNVSINSTSSQNTNTTVSNTNVATVAQTADVTSNTGGNTASGNISTGGTGSSINTGAATTNVTMGVTANKNTTGIGMMSPSSTNMTDVVNTGDHATVNTGTNTNTNTTVTNVNEATVAQALSAKSNTGYNTANSNIGGGTVTTGAAGATAALGTAVNSNQTVLDNYSVGGTAGTQGNGTAITNTGDYATVNSANNLNTNTTVTNVNAAYLSQSAMLKSNSGKNTANSNIGGGMITSGPSLVGAQFGIQANSNVTGIGGLFTMPSLNVQDVVNTGDHLTANTGVNANLNTTVDNTDALYSAQYYLAHSNSGYNHTMSNIGGTVVTSGGAGLMDQTGIMANSNTTLLGGLFSALFGLMNAL